MRFLSIIPLLFLPAVAAIAQPDDTLTFHGTAIYTLTSHALPGSEAHELFKAFAPTAQKVVFGSNGRLRLTEDDGASTDVIIDLPNDIHYRLNHDDSLAQKLVRTDYEAYFSPTVLEPVEGEEIISGHRARKYRVVSSQFVRRGAAAYVWVADDVRLVRERGDYNHEESGFRALFPLPMVLGVSEGTVMKAEITEQEVTVIYTAELQPGEPADEIFMIPAGYRVE